MLFPDLAAHLPAGLDADKVTACVTIHAGISSSSGETHLLVHGGQMVAISRVSSVFPFAIFGLDQSRPPRLESRYGSQRIFLRTKDGIEHWLTLADVDKASALESLAALYEGCGAWQELVTTLKAEIERSTSEGERAPLRRRLAGVLADRLGDAEGAVGILRDVLLYHPEDGASIDALAAIFASGRARSACRLLLEPAYVRAERWEELVVMLRLDLEDLDIPSRRHELLMRIVDICFERLGEPSRAMDVCGEVLLDRPGDLMAREKLEEVAAAADEWTRAARILSAASEAASEVADRLALSERLGEVLEHRLGDLAGAEAAWSRVLSLDAGRVAAYEALRRLLTLQRRWPEEAALYEGEIAHSAPARQVELLLALGHLQEDRLQDQVAAVASFERALALDAAQEEAAEHLERIFSEGGQWSRLFALLERRAGAALDPSERAELLLRQAQIAFELLDRPTVAIDLWSKVLDLRPRAPGALRGLSGGLEAAGRWLDLVEVLEDLVEITKAPAELLDASRKLGRIWKKQLHNDARALPWWVKVSAASPQDVEALTAITTIAERQGDDKALVGALAPLIPLLPEGERLAALIKLAAAHQRLGQPEAALAAWSRALEIDGGHPEALDALERLYTEKKRWDGLAQILKVRLDRAEDAPTKIALLERLGDLQHDKIADADAAVGAWRAILALDARHAGAIERLHKLYKASGRWPALIELLLAQRANAADPEKRLALAHEAAAITRDLTKQPERTFEILVSALPDGWRDKALIQELGKLAARTGSWRPLADALLVVVGQQLDAEDREAAHAALDEAIRPVAVSDNIHDAVVIYRHLAAGAEAQKDVEHAIAWMRRALDSNPGRAETWAALRRALRDARRWEELARHLEAMAKVEARGIEDPVEVYNELAFVCETHLGDSARGQEARKMAEEIGTRSARVLYALFAALLALAAGVAIFITVGQG